MKARVIPVIVGVYGTVPKGQIKRIEMKNRDHPDLSTVKINFDA